MTPDEMTRDDELRRIAAHVAEEIVRTAAAAAGTVAATAAQAAQALAQETQIDLRYIKTDLAEIKDRLDKRFVSNEAFDPVRRLVYGLAGLVLGSVVLALVALVIMGREK